MEPVLWGNSSGLMDKMEEEEEEEEVEEAGVPIPARFEVLSFLCAKLSPLQITPSVRYCFFNKNSDEENPFRLFFPRDYFPF